MLSPENEKVGLGKGLKARGNVEDWLGKVEEAMFSNLRRLTKFAIGDFEQKTREEWVLCHCSQVVLTVSQMMWCRDITEILTSDFDRLEGMRGFEQKSFKDLGNLAAIVRGELPKLARAVLCALITIDVHARDMVTGMVKNEVSIAIFMSLVGNDILKLSHFCVSGVQCPENCCETNIALLQETFLYLYYNSL